MVGLRRPYWQEAWTRGSRQVWEFDLGLVPHPDFRLHMCTKRKPRFPSSMTVVDFADGLLTPVKIFACFNELKFNTQPRMNKVIATSIGSAAITYEVVRPHEAKPIAYGLILRRAHRTLQLGIVGYLTFGQGVSSNVIAM